MRVVQEPRFRFSRNYAGVLVYLAVILTYSVFVPLILPFGVFLIAVRSSLERRNFRRLFMRNERFLSKDLDSYRSEIRLLATLIICNAVVFQVFLGAFFALKAFTGFSATFLISGLLTILYGIYLRTRIDQPDHIRLTVAPETGIVNEDNDEILEEEDHLQIAKKGLCRTDDAEITNQIMEEVKLAGEGFYANSVDFDAEGLPIHVKALTPTEKLQFQKVWPSVGHFTVDVLPSAA